MRTTAFPALLAGGLLGSVLLLAGCGREEGVSPAVEPGGPGEVVVSLLPGVQGRAGAEEVARVAAAVRRRLGKLGFEEVSVETLPDDELLVRFSSSPSRASGPGKIMDQAFLRAGVIEVRQMHSDSERLVTDLKLFAEAGPDWWVAEGADGRRHVVGEARLVGVESVIGVETPESSTGVGFDVVARLDSRGSRILGELKAKISRQPIALLLDGKVLAAPLPAPAIGTDRIFVVRGVSEAEARELAFVLEAPLVVPLQTKGQGAM